MRKVTLCYFLEDGTMSVSEPRQDNSGIEFQGTAVKRHLIPREGRQRQRDLRPACSWRHCHVLREGRTSWWTATNFTRDFYTECGVKVPEAIPYPGDSYTQARSAPQKVKENGVPMRKHQRGGNEDQAIFCGGPCDEAVPRDTTAESFALTLVGDDRSSLYGCFRYFTLYFFLADGTIEVVEKQQNNSGRDPFPSFVRRQKGAEAARRVL